MVSGPINELPESWDVQQYNNVWGAQFWILISRDQLKID